MLRKKTQGQTTFEYTIILILVIASLLSIQNYLKRGLQGRWKGAVDDLGDQYDPRTAITSIQHTMTSTTNTQIIASEDDKGFWTRRTDDSESSETKTGSTTVGAY